MFGAMVSVSLPSLTPRGVITKSSSPGRSPRIRLVGTAPHVPFVQIVPLRGAVGLRASQPTRWGDVMGGGVGHLPTCSSSSCPPGQVVVGINPSPWSSPTHSSAVLGLNVPRQASRGGREAWEVDVARRFGGLRDGGRGHDTRHGFLQLGLCQVQGDGLCGCPRPSPPSPNRHSHVTRAHPWGRSAGDKRNGWQLSGCSLWW